LKSSDDAYAFSHFSSPKICPSREFIVGPAWRGFATSADVEHSAGFLARQMALGDGDHSADFMDPIHDNAAAWALLEVF